ncbi:MAG: hypothetical protein HY923_09630 [Elusimicrobia bacterium]|nr:hypothetical protein [Elusimicrobiota bacterium]
MTIFRALLSLILALPAAAQVRVVSGLSVSGAPAPAVLAPVSAPSALAPLSSALTPSLLSAAALPEKPSAPVPAAAPVAARTASVLRDDADRLYASLAAIHSRVKAGEKESALSDLKLALLGDFDGVVKTLAVAESGDELRARIKTLRAVRAKAEKALEKAPAASRAEASKALASVSGELGAYQLKAARELLAASSPVGPRAVKRNAALWSLVGAHNSAAAAATEGAYLEALARGEETFGDGRPYLYWNRWRNFHTELKAAARDARNGRGKRAAETLRDAAAVLRGTGDGSDAAAAAELERIAAAPDSSAILAARALIKHPALKSRAPVAYADLGASLRALVHTLESGRADYLETAASEANLRRAAALLSSPRPSPAELQLAARLAASVDVWAKRGRVDAKRTAALNLDSASLALARGDRALAAKHVGWAADALEERRDEIRRIGLSVRGRLRRALAV